MAHERPPPFGGVDEAARDAARASKRDAIVRALREHGGNRTRAALALGLSSATNLRRAARRAGLDIDAIGAPAPEDIGGARLTDAERAARQKPKRKPAAKTTKRGAKPRKG
jgi:hypothetical protein